MQKALADASLHLEPPGGSAAESLMADVHSPEYFLPAAESQQLLHAAVLALPATLRHIMEQIDLGDGSVASLADALGTTPGIVAQKRSEAIRLLRDETADAPADTGRPRTASPV